MSSLCSHQVALARNVIKDAEPLAALDAALSRIDDHSSFVALRYGVCGAYFRHLLAPYDVSDAELATARARDAVSLAADFSSVVSSFVVACCYTHSRVPTHPAKSFSYANYISELVGLRTHVCDPDFLSAPPFDLPDDAMNPVFALGRCAVPVISVTDFFLATDPANNGTGAAHVFCLPLSPWGLPLSREQAEAALDLPPGWVLGISFASQTPDSDAVFQLTPPAHVSSASPFAAYADPACKPAMTGLPEHCREAYVESLRRTARALAPLTTEEDFGIIPLPPLAVCFADRFTGIIQPLPRTEPEQIVRRISATPFAERVRVAQRILETVQTLAGRGIPFDILSPRAFSLAKPCAGTSPKLPIAVDAKLLINRVGHREAQLAAFYAYIANPLADAADPPLLTPQPFPALFRDVCLGPELYSFSSRVTPLPMASQVFAVASIIASITEPDTHRQGVGIGAFNSCIRRLSQSPDCDTFGLPRAAWAMICRCMDRRPSLRPTLDELAAVFIQAAAVVADRQDQSHSVFQAPKPSRPVASPRPPVSAEATSQTTPSSDSPALTPVAASAIETHDAEDHEGVAVSVSVSVGPSSEDGVPSSADASISASPALNVPPRPVPDPSRYSLLHAPTITPAVRFAYAAEMANSPEHLPGEIVDIATWCAGNRFEAGAPYVVAASSAVKRRLIRSLAELRIALEAEGIEAPAMVSPPVVESDSCAQDVVYALQCFQAFISETAIASAVFDDATVDLVVEAGFAVPSFQALRFASAAISFFTLQDTAHCAKLLKANVFNLLNHCIAFDLVADDDSASPIEDDPRGGFSSRCVAVGAAVRASVNLLCEDELAQQVTELLGGPDAIAAQFEKHVVRPLRRGATSLSSLRPIGFKRAVTTSLQLTATASLVTKVPPTVLPGLIALWPAIKGEGRINVDFMRLACNVLTDFPQAAGNVWPHIGATEPADDLFAIIREITSSPSFNTFVPLLGFSAQCLARFALLDGREQQFLADGGLDCLKVIMDNASNDHRSVCESLRCLQWLMVDNATHSVIGEAGFVPRVLDALDRFDARSIAFHGSRAVFKFSIAAHGNRTRLIAAGGISRLVALCDKHLSSANILQCSASALCNSLTASGTEEDAFNADALGLVRRIIAAHDDADLVDSCIRIVFFMHTPELTKRMAAADAYSLMLELMFKAPLINTSLYALRYLLSAGEHKPNLAAIFAVRESFTGYLLQLVREAARSPYLQDMQLGTQPDDRAPTDASCFSTTSLGLISTFLLFCSNISHFEGDLVRAGVVKAVVDLILAAAGPAAAELVASKPLEAGLSEEESSILIPQLNPFGHSALTDPHFCRRLCSMLWNCSFIGKDVALRNTFLVSGAGMAAQIAFLVYTTHPVADGETKPDIKPTHLRIQRRIRQWMRRTTPEEVIRGIADGVVGQVAEAESDSEGSDQNDPTCRVDVD
jgi:hypothetical protein